MNDIIQKMILERAEDHFKRGISMAGSICEDVSEEAADLYLARQRELMEKVSG